MPRPAALSFRESPDMPLEIIIPARQTFELRPCEDLPLQRGEIRGRTICTLISQGTEIGWAIRPQFFGRGYAFEAAVAAMDYACDVLGWTEIIHTIHHDNAPSIRLAERLGSLHVRDAELAPAGSGVHGGIWAPSAQDWAQHRQSFLHLLSP